MCNWLVKKVSVTRSFIPLNLVDKIWISACAITNMQPPLVKD